MYITIIYIVQFYIYRYYIIYIYIIREKTVQCCLDTLGTT